MQIEQAKIVLSLQDIDAKIAESHTPEGFEGRDSGQC